MKTPKLNNVRLLTLALILFIAAGCERKELYTHEEIYTGAVRFRLDWQAISPTSPNMQVRIRGTHEGIPTDTLFSIAPDGEAILSLLESDYTVTAWHEAENISFDGTVFRIKAGSDGLLTELSALSAATGTLTAEAGNEIRYALRMRPQTRLFKLALNIDKGEPGLLTGITGILSGVATARHISDGVTNENGTCGNSDMCGEGAMYRNKEGKTYGNGSMHLVFQRQGNVLTAGHLLLGTAPDAQQILTLTLHYAGGEPQTETYDLTSLLAGFNGFGTGGGTEPFTVNGKLSLDQSVEEAGITGSINDWTAGTETDMDAGNQ